VNPCIESSTVYCNGTYAHSFTDPNYTPDITMPSTALMFEQYQRQAIYIHSEDTC